MEIERSLTEKKKGDSKCYPFSLILDLTSTFKRCIIKENKGRGDKMISLDGKPIAKKIYDKIQPKLEGKTLSVVMEDVEKESLSYLKQIQKSASEIGVKVKVESFIDRYLIEPPILYISPVDALYIKIYQDVDCIGIESKIAFYLDNDTKYSPSTPKAVLKIIDYYNLGFICGKNVTIVGRGEKVGRPLAHLLQLNDYTVTLVHSKTPNMNEHLESADIIVSAVGKKGIVNKTWCNSQALIDVGRGDIIGAGICDCCTPVIGGVGVVTTACMFEHMYEILNGDEE